MLIYVLCRLKKRSFIYINSPERAVSFYNKTSNLNNNAVLKKSTINQHLKLAFSMDNEDLYIYILNKNTLKHWKVADMLGINKVYDVKPNDLAWTGLGYNKDIGYKFFYWGVINNSSVKKSNYK